MDIPSFADPPFACPPDGWTDERVDLLKKLWADGLSATEVARELGGGLSRNAILGKIHRLGCAARDIGYKQRAGRKARKTQTIRDVVHRIRVRKEIQKAPKVVEQPAPAEFLGLQFHQLTATTCRYPRGDNAPYLFCGQPVKTDSSYCPHCHFITHRVSEPSPMRKGHALLFVVGGRAA